MEANKRHVTVINKSKAYHKNENPVHEHKSGDSIITAWYTTAPEAKPSGQEQSMKRKDPRWY